MNTPSIDELSGPDFQLAGQMTHATLADFVIEYFFRRVSWVVALHHALSLIVFAAAIVFSFALGRSFLQGLADFALAFFAMLVILLPIHELLHAAGYRAVGARDIRWDYSPKMAAVWVIAHRFVAARGPFIFVALLPFLVINGALLILLVLWPERGVFVLFLLLWHVHGCAGDWGLLNFIWLHRDRGFWTFDDADEGKSYFYVRAAEGVR